VLNDLGDWIRQLIRLIVRFLADSRGSPLWLLLQPTLYRLSIDRIYSSGRNMSRGNQREIDRQRAQKKQEEKLKAAGRVSIRFYVCRIFNIVLVFVLLDPR
jgi:4F5 protein related disordered region